MRWSARWPPLIECAVGAVGASAQALVARLINRETEMLSLLRGVARVEGDPVVVILGDREALPWSEGVTYLGQPSSAPGLLLPTNLQPSVPEALLERQLCARAQPPLATWPQGDGLLLVPLGAARPLSRAKLEAFLEGRS